MVMLLNSSYSVNALLQLATCKVVALSTRQSHQRIDSFLPLLIQAVSISSSPSTTEHISSSALNTMFSLTSFDPCAFNHHVSLLCLLPFAVTSGWSCHFILALLFARFIPAIFCCMQELAACATLQLA